MNRWSKLKDVLLLSLQHFYILDTRVEIYQNNERCKHSQCNNICAAAPTVPYEGIEMRCCNSVLAMLNDSCTLLSVTVLAFKL